MKPEDEENCCTAFSVTSTIFHWEESNNGGRATLNWWMCRSSDGKNKFDKELRKKYITQFQVASKYKLQFGQLDFTAKSSKCKAATGSKGENDSKLSPTLRYQSRDENVTGRAFRISRDNSFLLLQR